MNTETIKKLKERAKEMLEDNYDRKIGDEEIYTIICELENFYTAYEKEKGENVKLRLQDIPLIEGELKAYKDRVNELKQELEKEKEKNKKAIDFINDKNNYFEDGENWQNILKIKEILEE